MAFIFIPAIPKRLSTTDTDLDPHFSVKKFNKKLNRFNLHIPIYLLTLHMLLVFLSQFLPHASYIHDFEYVPTEVHDRQPEMQMHNGHFYPNRCMEYSPIFHTDD